MKSRKPYRAWDSISQPFQFRYNCEAEKEILMTDDTRQFYERNQKIIEAMTNDATVQDINRLWLSQSLHYEYSYHFTWMGLPIIQYPQDIVAMQEIMWQVKPDLIIETGIARGGSL